MAISHCLALDLVVGARRDQRRDHAALMRNEQVVGDVLEHGGASRIDAVTFEESSYVSACGLAEIGGHDVEHVLEQVVDADLPAVRRAWSREPLVRMSLRPATRRCPGQRMVGLERGTVDVVDEGQEFLGRDLVLGHQAAQGRAVALVVIFLQARDDMPSSPNNCAMNRVMRWSIFGQTSEPAG